MSDNFSNSTTGVTDVVGSAAGEAAPETAGAFDIRNIIALLMGIFGVILLFAWIAINPGINPDTGDPKNASYNLITGVCLILAAVVFAAWAKLKPIRVDSEAQAIREAHHEELERQRQAALERENNLVNGSVEDADDPKGDAHSGK